MFLNSDLVNINVLQKQHWIWIPPLLTNSVFENSIRRSGGSPASEGFKNIENPTFLLLCAIQSIAEVFHLAGFVLIVVNKLQIERKATVV